jgi:hypothetical protein
MARQMAAVAKEVFIIRIKLVEELDFMTTMQIRVINVISIIGLQPFSHLSNSHLFGKQYLGYLVIGVMDLQGSSTTSGGVPWKLLYTTSLDLSSGSLL